LVAELADAVGSASVVNGYLSHPSNSLWPVAIKAFSHPS